jgi:hypothetical protein
LSAIQLNRVWCFCQAHIGIEGRWPTYREIARGTGITGDAAESALHLLKRQHHAPAIGVSKQHQASPRQ